MWRETTLLIDRAVQFAIAKTYVFSDSVLCVGGHSIEPAKAWESKIKWFLETRYLKELDRIDGEPMEFEWQIIAGFTTSGILDEIQHFQRRVSFMSMFNDIDCPKTRKQRQLYCELRALTMLLSMLEDSREDIGHF